MTAANPSPETSARSSTESDRRRRTARRSQRIADYLTAALEHDNPLIANVGAANADLMEAQHFLRQVMDDTLATLTGSLEDLLIVEPAINGMMKIAKQIGAFTHLELKLKANEHESEQADAALELALDQVQRDEPIGDE